MQVWYTTRNVTVHTHRAEVAVGDEIFSPEPKVFKLLVYLMQNARRVVGKSELLDVVWTQEVVCESALTRAVCCIRKLLSDNARTPTFVRTVHGLGYEFLAPVREHVTEPESNDAWQRHVSSRPPNNDTGEPRFVGRATETARLGALLRETHTSHPRLILITGEGGIGKTRLIAEVLRANLDVREAHWGRASCVEGVPGFSMWRRCFASVARERSLPTLLHAFRGVSTHTQRLLLGNIPTLWSESFDLGSSPPVPTLEFDIIARAVEHLARQKPLFFLLDDLHSADLNSLLLLRAILTKTLCPLTLVATLRSRQPCTNPATQTLLSNIRTMSEKELALQGFSLAEATELVTHMVPVQPHDRFIELHDQTRGNPFLLLLATRFHDGHLPDKLHRAVVDRLAQLPAECVELLMQM